MIDSARLVVLISVFVHGCGFGKTLLIAHWFGASAALDGYYLALVLPTLLVGVVTGVLQAGFVPVYLDIARRDDSRNANAFLRELWTLLLAVLIAGGVSLYLCSDGLAALLVWGDDAAVRSYTARALPFAALVLMANAAVDFLSLVLNVRRRFALAAASPLVSLAVSSAFLAATPVLGFDALLYGLAAGILLQLALLLWGLYFEGVSLRPRRPRNTAWMRRSLSLAGLMLFGVLFANLNSSIDQLMASSLDAGSVSRLGYAGRFHGIIVQVFITGTGAVLFPYLADLVLAGKQRQISELFRDLALLLAFIAVAVAISVLLLGAPVLEVLLNHGAMTTADTLKITEVWFYYSLGLLPMGWGIFLTRYFQSAGRPGFITGLAALAVLANILLNLLLIDRLGVAGLALATSLVYLLTAVLYQFEFARRTRFEFRRSRGRILVALLLLALMAWWNDPGTEPFAFAYAVAVVLAVGIALVTVLELPGAVRRILQTHG